MEHTNDKQPQQPTGSATSSQRSILFDVGGGDWTHAHVGNIEKKIVKNFYSQGSTEPSLTLQEGDVPLPSNIVLHENKPIDPESRVFHGTFGSKVTGNKRIALKLLRKGDREIKEAINHDSIPDHPHIVRRIRTDIFKCTGQQPQIFIAMELCETNLYNFVKTQVRQQVPFDSEKFLSFAEQIATGLSFLHSLKMVHRDLKPPNVLLTNNCTVAKISDFGLSKPVTGQDGFTKQSAVNAGTDGWKSPEVLRGDDVISTAADIFSLGCIFYFLWSYGKHPYGTQPHSWNHFILNNAMAMLDELRISNPTAAKALIHSMLQGESKNRPTAEQILGNAVFKSKGGPAQADNWEEIEEALTQDKVLYDRQYFEVHLRLIECALMAEKNDEAQSRHNAFVELLKLQNHKPEDLVAVVDECQRNTNHVQGLIVCLSTIMLSLHLVKVWHIHAPVLEGIKEYASKIGDVASEMVQVGSATYLQALENFTKYMHTFIRELGTLRYPSSTLAFEAKLWCFLAIGVCHYHRKEHQRGIDELNDAIAMAEKEYGEEAKCRKVHGFLLQLIGLMYTEMGNVSVAADMYVAALDSYEAAKDWTDEKQKKSYMRQARNEMLAKC